MCGIRENDTKSHEMDSENQGTTGLPKNKDRQDTKGLYRILGIMNGE